MKNLPPYIYTLFFLILLILPSFSLANGGWPVSRYGMKEMRFSLEDSLIFGLPYGEITISNLNTIYDYSVQNTIFIKNTLDGSNLYFDWARIIEFRGICYDEELKQNLIVLRKYLGQLYNPGYLNFLRYDAEKKQFEVFVADYVDLADFMGFKRADDDTNYPYKCNRNNITHTYYKTKKEPFDPNE